MQDLLWLSQTDVEKTGICSIEEAVKIVEKTFHLFTDNQAKIIPETALRVAGGEEAAYYALPAYVGGD